LRAFGGCLDYPANVLGRFAPERRLNADPLQFRVAGRILGY
jgi:hypothetical protein